MREGTLRDVRRQDGSDVHDDGRRCPSCGALVAADATWCGQCYADLRAVEAASPARGTEATGTGAATGSGMAAADPPSTGEAGRPDPGWPCAVCGARNPLDLDTCATCGTPFAALMRDEPAAPEVDPKDALTWSLVFPGLGHRVVGRPLDGLARGVLFAVSFAMALLVGLTGVRSGPAFLVFALFLITAIVVYAGSALEAHRVARGAGLVVSSRALLWVLVAVIMLSVVMLALAAVSATRG